MRIFEEAGEVESLEKLKWELARKGIAVQ